MSGTAVTSDQPAFARHFAHLGGLSLHISERRLLLLAGDLLAMGLALFLALWLRPETLMVDGPLSLRNMYLPWWLVLWLLWTPIAIAANCYDLKMASHAARSAVHVMGSAALVSAIYLVVPIVSAPLSRSRLTWFLFALLAVALTSLWRLAYARLLRQPTFVRHALAVGAGRCGRELAAALKSLGGEAGVQFVGYVDDDPALAQGEFEGAQVLGQGDDLAALVAKHHVEDVVLAITDWHDIRPGLMDALVRCWEQGAAIIPMPLYYEDVLGAIPVRHLGQNLFALATPHSYTLHRLWFSARRALDLLAGLIGLGVLLALLPLLALAMTLDCRGPLLYRQQRVGRGGELFWLWKLRSMIPNAEAHGAQWATQGDPRITRVGRWLRRTRLDELPQAWNLLTGTMTLIGPRPERPEFVRRLDELVPYYAVRHAIKPGITGWAQVRYHYGSSVDDALIKLQYDLYYVKNRGPVLDLLILLATVRVVLRLEGA